MQWTWRAVFRDRIFARMHRSDMIGVEVGGATKNVLAIGAGISDGLGFGANTRVAMITRGLAEMMRFGVALGADKDTFMGLAGLGDLVLTCTDDQSRNRRLGLALAAGKSAERGAARHRPGGRGCARGPRRARRGAQGECRDADHRADLRVIYEGAPPRDAVRALMGRTVKSETQ